MPVQFKGRVVELWIESSDGFFELIAGSQRTLFKVNHEDTPMELYRGLKRGDLLEGYAQASVVLNLKKIGGPAQDDWSPLSDSMRWRRPLGEVSRMTRLLQRQQILDSIRQDLYSQDFLEVETPLLVKGACPDTHIDSIVAGRGEDLGYLVTSTEYQIKRLMVGGFERVFTLTKNFRAGDRGRYHSSEFTMLEWARAFGSLDEIETDAVRFIQKAFRRIYPGKVEVLDYEGSSIDLRGEHWERLTVREAFEKHLGLKNLHDFSLDALCCAAQKAGIELPETFIHDQHLVLSFLLDQLQPNLGREVPTFLREWPAFMTSSAELSRRDPFVAERSELYIAGIEVSDGFPFLRDSKLQKELFARENSRRASEGKAVVRLDQHYLDALAEGIPEGAGMALGVDRLVMVLTGASKLVDVQAFGWDEL